MDIIVSLEALIQRATDLKNQTTDRAAVDAICGLLRRHPSSCASATRQLALCAQTASETEALHALNVLDTCMIHCGPAFHAEVGKFRFLNELIKIVSPKYLGESTPKAVSARVIELFDSWTINYPNEGKIREAYDMLKRQGVVNTQQVVNTQISKPTSTLFRDEEFERKLQKLLASKNSEDLEAANRMIKSRVLETERRAGELEQIRSSVKLLSEMISSVDPSPCDLQLMAELRTECERLRPNLYRMAAETTDNATLAELLFVSDELSSVLEQHTAITSQIRTDTNNTSSTSNSALLDLSSPGVPQIDDLIGNVELSQESLLQSFEKPTNGQTSRETENLDALADIFRGLTTTPSTNSSKTIANPQTSSEKSSKQKALDELDFLGETMMLQCKMGLADLSSASVNGDNEKCQEQSEDSTLLLLDAEEIKDKASVMSLNNLEVSLDEIIVSDLPPISAISARGISVTLYIARNKPRDDVTVIVVTTTSTCQSAISNIMFQAIVPQTCKVKLLSPSGVNLPAFKPFLPPAAVSQVMLIARPEKNEVHLRCVISFTLDNETITQFGEIHNLPTC